MASLPPLIGPRPAPASSSSDNLSPIENAAEPAPAANTETSGADAMHDSEDDVSSGPESNKGYDFSDDSMDNAMDDTVLDEQRVTVQFTLDGSSPTVVDLFQLGGCDWTAKLGVKTIGTSTCRQFVDSPFACHDANCLLRKLSRLTF